MRAASSPAAMAALGPEYGGILTPSWFQPETTEAFRRLELRDTDVVLCTYPKCGTTWAHKIINCFRTMNDDGEVTAEPDINTSGQVYPDAVPMERPDHPHQHFGFACYSEILAQADPRLFSTHLPAHLLPEALTKGKGKLVYVVRNPKDTITSLHFFMGEAKDGWLGNEHGAGSFNRFLADPTPNAYGNMWDHILGVEDLVGKIGPERSLVLYFERMKADPRGEVARVAEFLGRGGNDKLIDAVVRATSFGAMQKEREGKPLVALTRKGQVGDWQNYLDAETWSRVDKLFEKKCGHSKLYQPLKEWMRPKEDASQQKL